MSRQDIRLRDLWQSRRGMWAVAWLLGAVTQRGGGGRRGGAVHGLYV